MKQAFLSTFVLLITCGAVFAETTVRFNRDIRPILSENCYACHGPDSNARQAGLRLDRREEALAAGAIQPGEVENSKLVQRVRSTDQVKVMPPVYSDKKLTDEQKDLLVRWVKEGAEYEGHWAYIPPERPRAPQGAAGIDHLVNAKLAEKDLQPVAATDRRTLLRRLSFDLTGLPPSARETGAFLSDESPQAYESLVERLLASPHFGERMAVSWLDLVRYADSVGFHNDLPINVYLYRDYVIRAFNENKPFDRFTREQLAGDLMPNPTDAQRVASAYNRLNRMTNEGGAQPKEYLAKYATDRVRNVSTVWLGSTLGCAECHDHKFDPFATKDFYQMAAFFADIQEQGVYGGRFHPLIRVLSDEAKQELASIQDRVGDLRREGGKLKAKREALEEFRTYLRERLEEWRVIEPERVWNDCEHPEIDGCEDIELRLERDGYFSQVVTGEEKPDEAVQRVEAALDGGRITAVALEIFPAEGFEEFYLGEFAAELYEGGRRPRTIRMGALVADRQGPDSLLRGTIDGNPRLGWQGNLAEEGPRRAMWVFEEPLETQAGWKLRFTMEYNGRGSGKIAGRSRLWLANSDFPELLPDDRLREAVLADGELTRKQRGALKKTFLRWTRSNAEWRERRKLERRRATLFDQADECLVAEVSDELREVRILPRGDWMNDSGEIVESQSPHFLKQIPTTKQRLTRLDLANWLVDRENPLTARVFVNRLWKTYFGTGLSKVLDDLGAQGETPIHQELLDSLAVEFMESGWDVKHIVRTMVLSEAYRRSSEPSDALAQADPDNRLHGRQTMRRLDAEFVRDHVLAVSGLLNRKMFGPSAKPYQPAGYYRDLNFPKRVYKPDLDENQYRRGLYTHWQRTFTHPSLVAFDAPSREECTAERPVSNTPLQSLILLNDPTYVEAAKAFAERILRSGAADEKGRIDFAFHEAFSREANAKEHQVLTRLLVSQRKHLEENPDKASEMLLVGLAPAPPDLDTAEWAVWMGVSRAILNKHEFIMRY